MRRISVFCTLVSGCTLMGSRVAVAGLNYFIGSFSKTRQSSLHKFGSQFL